MHIPRNTKEIGQNNVINIGLIRRLCEFLPRDSLVTIYKSHVRRHLDYGDIVYDRPGNSTFSEKLESVQYGACLAIRLDLKKCWFAVTRPYILEVGRSVGKIFYFGDF